MDKNRRKFIQIGSSAGLGALFAGGTGYGVWTAVKHPERLFYGSPITAGEQGDGDSSFHTPYQLTHSFDLNENIVSVKVYNGLLYMATDTTLFVYGIAGQKQASYPIASGIRDLSVFQEQVFLLYPTHVQVLSLTGKEIRLWEACSEDSDYCQLVACAGGVFVTDAGSKNICQYSLEGNLLRFIQSPQGFVVPSYCFGITEHEGIVYCSNPGRHLIEKYDYEGQFIESFGKAGRQPGSFCGCCNPVYITLTPSGEILTSEKGLPRICCFGPDGMFHSQLLDGNTMGGGHAAHRMCLCGDKLVTVNEKTIMVFRYKKVDSSDNLCGSCTLDCPLKTTTKG